LHLQRNERYRINFEATPKVGVAFRRSLHNNNKNCSLSTVLTATDQKPQKIIKKVILPTITLPECQRDAE